MQDVNDMNIDQLFRANCSDKSAKNRQTILFEKTPNGGLVPSKLFFQKNPHQPNVYKACLPGVSLQLRPGQDTCELLLSLCGATGLLKESWAHVV